MGEELLNFGFDWVSAVTVTQIGTDAPVVDAAKPAVVMATDCEQWSSVYSATAWYPPGKAKIASSPLYNAALE